MARKGVLLNNFPAKKMTLAWKIFNITFFESPPIVSRRPGLYRSKFGNHLPKSPQDLASKRPQYAPKRAKNLQKHA
jgi:hypothetical protein